ncbi:MAG: glycosyl hydrolase [Fibrobacter sp.]|nr:glycosyl hydrolase [Fibrobacter sp.]
MKGLVQKFTVVSAAFGVACLAGIASPAHAQTKVVVDPGKKYQVFEGWGTSLCWWAVKAGAWSEANRSSLIGAIADPDTGLGYTIFRYNIGGGDQPGHNHLTKGDGGGKVPGYKPTEKGDYDWTADPYQRAIALELAKRVKDPIFEAFSNSPPWWMTKSGCVSGSSDGSDNLKEDYFDDFADYLSEVALHFKTEWGLTFRTVEPFNEPSAGWWKSNGGQEGCGFKNNQSRMIVELGKALQKKGLFPETSVSAADETSIKQAHDQLGNYTAEALSYLGQVNTHSYSDGSYRKQLFNRAFGLNKRLWQSETGPLSKSGDEHIALWMANVIIQDLRDMHAEAWIDWQIGDPAENWRSLALNHSKQTFTPNARYYMHAAFSRYIRPGSRIIDSDNGNTLAALRPDGALVLIVRNSGSSDVKYSFDLGEFVKIGTSAKVVRFELPGSLTKQSDIAVSGKALSMTAKANTITTMVIDGAEGGACKPDSIIPYVKIHSNSGWDETTDVKLNKGDSLVIGPHPWEGGRWVWTGPKDFGSTSREIRFKNMDGTMSGYYKAVHTNASGCEGSVTFKVVVDDPDHPFVEPDTNVTDSTGDTSTVALHEFGMCQMESFRSGEPLQVFDVQGHLLKNVQEFRPQDFRPGIYVVKQGFRVRQIRVE